MSVGPLLYMRGMAGREVRLTALIIRPADRPAPAVDSLSGAAPGRVVLEADGCRAYLHDLRLPMAREAWYGVDGVRYGVATDFAGDLRLAFVSCNGQEKGDDERPLDQRNALWRRLADEHAERPFHLLLQGGDQIYADALLDAHPRLEAWANGAHDGSEDGSEDGGESAGVAPFLRRAFFRLYRQVLGQPAVAAVMARVPTLAMWDDHDICDGWGSLPVTRLDSPLGRCLFTVAREHFLLFQMGAAPHETPEICLDPSGRSLGWSVRLPGAHIIAPDLRSERRPDRVMGETGWSGLDSALAAVRDGRVILLSSVPALGPRLSWVEALMRLTPKMETYEDDLRDQWQSRAHRAEWRAFLERLAAVHARPGTAVTLVSGEIHLASRGTLEGPPAPLHQLIASGIAHPASPWLYARALGLLAWFGESPLADRTVRMRPLPGRRSTYTAQRNYLVMERREGAWRAWWELEADGATPALAL